MTEENKEICEGSKYYEGDPDFPDYPQYGEEDE